MSTQKEVDEALKTLQDAIQALKDYGFLIDPDEDEEDE